MEQVITMDKRQVEEKDNQDIRHDDERSAMCYRIDEQRQVETGKQTAAESAPLLPDLARPDKSVVELRKDLEELDKRHSAEIGELQRKHDDERNPMTNEFTAGIVRDKSRKHPSELVPVPASAHEPVNGRFAAMAPYWLDGLHNPEGLKLAEEINELIGLKKLVENEEAIKVILKTHSDARKFGIGVFAEEYYLNDPWRKANLAEPVTLLDGALVRDKEGAYRPAAGGSPVLVDKGDTAVVKDWERGPAAVIELMKAKGSTAIRLNGNKREQEAMWLAAMVGGLAVVDYEPSKETREKLADMYAKEALVKAAGGDIEIINKSQPCVSEGIYSGKILAVKDGVAVQKVGRDPDVVVRHDLKNLSHPVNEGEVLDIGYKGGQGIVGGRGVEKAGQGR